MSLLQVVRCVLDELVCLLGERGNRRRYGPARRPNTTTTTTMTAAHRGNFRVTSHDVAGSSPSAKKNAAPINTSTDDVAPRTRTAPYDTATPAEATNPT